MELGGRVRQLPYLRFAPSTPTRPWNRNPRKQPARYPRVLTGDTYSSAPPRCDRWPLHQPLRSIVETYNDYSVHRLRSSGASNAEPGRGSSAFRCTTASAWLAKFLKSLLSESIPLDVHDVDVFQHAGCSIQQLLHWLGMIHIAQGMPSSRLEPGPFGPSKASRICPEEHVPRGWRLTATVSQPESTLYFSCVLV